MAIYLGGRWEAVCLLVGEMLYAYHALLRLEKGLPRLLALVPLVPLSLAVPWSAPTGLERAIYCFVFLWIVGFKLLLLACDLGPGAAPLATSSFPRFVSAMTFTLHLPPDRHRPPDLRQFPGSLDDDQSTRKSGADCADSGSNGRRRTIPDGGKERESGEGAKPGGRRTIREGEEERESGQGDKTGRIRSWARSAAASQSATAVFLRTAAYFVAAAALERVAHSWRARSVSYYALNFLYGFLIYFAAHFLFDAAGAVPASVLGVGFAPSFDMPFLATSVADFWGRRWNLLVNRLLRASVYNPVRTMLGGGGGRRLAVASTFLVSGLMHEIIFFYVNRTRPSWEMTAFFVVNGVATAAEEVLSKWQPSLPLVPMLARRMYALGFVYLTACWLFFPPLARTGIVDESLRELRRFVEWTTRAEFLF